MKTNRYILSVLLLAVILVTACNEDYLDINPKGTLTASQLLSPENVEGFVTSAYSYAPHRGYWQGQWADWEPGSVRSDNAYKGGGGINDQQFWYFQEVFTLATPTMGRNDDTWTTIYFAISRTNNAINMLKSMDESDYPLKNARLGEMYFLRGYQYSKLKKRWKWVPIFKEDLAVEDYKNVPNRPSDGSTSDLSLWTEIYDDFKAAVDLLPTEQEDLGRPTKWAAEAWAAETMMWMAYEQDGNNKVVNINTSRLETALTYLDDIIQNGPYELAEDFANNFLPDYQDINPEFVWAEQYSVDDGLPNGYTNTSNILNTPSWAPHFTCCDFHKPSDDLVKAFKTGADGLPQFDTFQDEDIVGRGPEFFATNTFDPRLSHTVAMPGQPWKYDPELLFDSTGARAPHQYGYFNSMKEMLHPDWTSSMKFTGIVWSGMDQPNMRYAEVLLMKAEILIQLGRESEALPLINQVRQRAANSTDLLKFADESPCLDYNVQLYQPGVNCTWDKDFAMKALIWEKRLETACEGRRFFDLIRWGITEDIMNTYFDEESKRWSWLEVARFTSGRDEYLPIPQNQMNLSQGVYQQNPGY